MNPEHLTLHVGTVRRASFRELCQAASAGGFAAISLYPYFVPQAREAGLDWPDLRTLLDDHGLVIEDLDALLDWVPGVEAPPGLSGKEEDF